MSLVCDFTLGGDALPLTDVAATVSGTVHVERVIADRPHNPHIIVTGEGISPKRLETAMANGTRVRDVVRLESSFEATRFRITIDQPVPAVYERLVSLRTYPEGATITETGWRTRVQFATRDDLLSFRNTCQEMSVKFHLHRLFQSDSDDIDEYGLTAQQHNALAVAYDEGYFEIPREATLEDLADELDTTTSALSELLRRGQRRLVGRTVAALEGT